MSRQRVISLLVDVDGSKYLVPANQACKLAANGGVKAMIIVPSSDGTTASLGISRTPPGGVENKSFKRWVEGCTYLAQLLKNHDVNITGKVVLNILDHEGTSMLQQKEDGRVYLSNGESCSKDMAFRYVESFFSGWNKLFAEHYGMIEMCTFQKGHTVPMQFQQGKYYFSVY